MKVTTSLTRHLLVPLFLFTAGASHAGDRFKSFQELSAVYKEGVDYDIVLETSKEPYAIIAPHGGNIEFMSAELSRAIHKYLPWNLYLFIGRAKKADDLHLTSSRYDEPRALAMTKAMHRCLSIHGFREKAGPADQICVGGANAVYAKKMADALRASLPKVEVMYPCKIFPGTHKTNIVNMCKEQGVQLEISRQLRERMRSDAKYTDCVAQKISAASIDGKIAGKCEF